MPTPEQQDDHSQGPWEDEGEDAQSQPIKTSAQMLRLELHQAAEEFRRPWYGLLLSAVAAGLTIGVGLVLMVRLMVLAGDSVPPVAVELAAAAAYGLGFVLVILGHMDLFTEFTTIAILPVLAGQARWRALVRLWVLVYVGNLVGAVGFTVLLVLLLPGLTGGEMALVGHIGRELAAHPAWVMLVSGALAGWLMGLMSWLITGGRDTISQIVFIWVIGATIGLGRLHHSVIGTIEVLAGVWSDGRMGLLDLGRFLLWVTLGNATGGILFAAFVRFSLHMRHKQAPERGD